MIFPTFGNMLRTHLDSYGPADAICIVENQVAAAIKINEPVDIIYEISDEIISDADITRALDTSDNQLKQLHLMMLNCVDLELEEWVLTVSILSEVYCTYIFATRRGFTVQLHKIAKAVELVRECTSDFQDSRFKRGLAIARRQNPNPLPPPLQ